MAINQVKYDTLSIPYNVTTTESSEDSYRSFLFWLMNETTAPQVCFPVWLAVNSPIAPLTRFLAAEHNNESFLV